ncbi:MAG TPA: hypothetical protein VIJ51_14400 [Solirubrobacteraceae bacterium]
MYLCIVVLICAAALSYAPSTAGAADFSWSAPSPFGAFDYGLACPSVSQCTAVGFNAAGQGVAGASEETFNPAAPGLPTPAIVDPDHTTVIDVACPSTNQCTAVAGAEEVTFNPTAPGNPTPVAIDDNDNYAAMDAVACPSLTLCVTVGDAGQVEDGSGNQVLVMGQEETFNPESPGPAVATTPIDPAYSLGSVACPSVSECVAVGDSGQVVVFDPSSAASSASVSTIGTIGSGGLFGLACPSTSQCTAFVGDAQGVSQEVTFNPSSPGAPSPFTIDPGLVNNSTESNSLRDLACPSTTECVAVDTMGQAVKGDPTSSAPWTVEPVTTPDPNSDAGHLDSIACPSVTECAALDGVGREFTGTIGGAPAPSPANTAAPTIAGSTVQGQVLTESRGSWTNSPTSYAYQWFDCDGAGSACTAIRGATGQSYTLTAADVGHTIRVQETASNASGGGAPATSTTTAVVGGAPPTTPPPANTTPPAVTGTATVGRSVGCSSVWTGTPPLSFAYQWLRDGVAIPGATGSNYAIVAADAGKHLSCRVTASNAAGSATATSAAVGVTIIAADTVSVSRASTSGSTAAVSAACSGSDTAGCDLSLALSATETIRGGKLVALAAAAAETKHKVLSLGSARATISAGRHEVVHVKLNATGRRLLASHHHLKATLKIVRISPGGSRHAVSGRKLTFTE